MQKMESLFTTTTKSRQLSQSLNLSSSCHLLPPRPTAIIINSDNDNYNFHHLLQLKMSSRRSRNQLLTRTHCGKMYVPGFGKPSPEAKAAAQLHNFFTYLAVTIVSSQLQSYNPEAYEELMEFVSRNTLDDGDKFCATLMRESSRHKNLALRILEVRAAYCKRDFEWDNLKRLTAKMADDSNTKLMRDYVLETTSSLDTQS